MSEKYAILRWSKCTIYETGKEMLSRDTKEKMLLMSEVKFGH